MLGRRVQELLARADEQGRFLTEREQTSDSLRTDFSSAQQTVLDLRAALAEAEHRGRSSHETLEAERLGLEVQLKQSQAERDKLQNEIVSMKREAEATWATERMENAVLRERINDVAAEVARLTSVLEGPGSPIDTMLASARRGSAGAGRGRRPAQRRKHPRLARRPHAGAAKPRLAGAAAQPRLIFRDWRRAGGATALDTGPPCLKSCPQTGRLAQRESVPFTRERS